MVVARRRSAGADRCGPQALARAPAARAQRAGGPGGAAHRQDLAAGEPGAAGAVFRFDETRPDSRIARLEADDALQRAAGRKDAFAGREEVVKEPGARYIDFLIPGLLGMNLMGTGIWSLAFSVTTARSRRILKRLVATPMRKSHYLLAQMLARLGFLVPEMVILVGVGWLVFGVAGARLAAAASSLVCLLGAMSFCGLGLLIASRVSTIEGASGLANLVMLPMWLLSGVFFSSERFPDAVQPLIQRPAAHRPQRRPARGDERGPRPRRRRPADAEPGDLGRRELPGGALDLPVEVGGKEVPCEPSGPSNVATGRRSQAPSSPTMNSGCTLRMSRRSSTLDWPGPRKIRRLRLISTSSCRRWPDASERHRSSVS